MLAYLDNAATTPMRAEAVAAMLPYMSDAFGNPSGAHSVARRAREAVEESREIVAACLGAEPGEVVFTSGGTESDNLAVLGRVGATGGSAVCTAVEHRGVLGPCESVGGRAVPVDRAGVVDLDALAGAVGPGASVVSVMLANNEVGTVQPLAEVAEVVRRAAPQAALHTDAVQAFPWLDVAALTACCDLVTVSAHKFGGPKGVGALVARGGTRLAPIVLGGGHERGRRSGTHNVAGIVGMAAAARCAAGERAGTVSRVGDLRDRLADGILASVDGVEETVPRSRKVAGSCHLRFEGVESEELLVLLDDMGVCASAGSACSSGAVSASHVLLAMGMSAEEASTGVRFSLGPSTAEAEVDVALEVVPKAVARLRH